MRDVSNTVRVVVLACAALVLTALSVGLTMAVTPDSESAYSEGVRDGVATEHAINVGALAVLGFRPRLLVASQDAVEKGHVAKACPGRSHAEPAWTVGTRPDLVLVTCPGGVPRRADR